MSEPQTIRIRDVMQQNFALANGIDTVEQALALMKEKRAQAVIVKKRYADDEYGMMLPSDVAKHVLARNRSPARVNVYEVMAKPVIAVRPDMALRHCAALFERFGLSCAPVMEKGEVVGVVSYNDMVLGG